MGWTSESLDTSLRRRAEVDHLQQEVNLLENPPTVHRAPPVAAADVPTRESLRREEDSGPCKSGTRLSELDQFWLPT
jgi:hypothetical protein